MPDGGCVYSVLESAKTGKRQGASQGKVCLDHALVEVILQSKFEPETGLVGASC